MDMHHVTDLLNIVDLIRSGKARTRRDIGTALSMRSTSVSELVGTLTAGGLLTETIVSSSGRGRPAAALTFNAQRFGAILISVVDLTLVARTIDMDFHIRDEIVATPPEDVGNEQMAATIHDLVTTLMARFPAGVEPGVVVLSLAGLLDVAQGVWCVSSRWPNLCNLELEHAFPDLQVPVHMIRNLDAELLGLRLDRQATTDESNILLLHWGYGIGAAYANGDTVVNRMTGRFCEIGHWSLGNSRGRACTCGNTDCLETVAALWAISPALQTTCPDLPLTEKALAAELRRVDLPEVPALEEAVTQMLLLTTNLCRLLFPERIILTGPFVQHPEIFRRFVEAIASAPLLKSLDRIRVSVSEFVPRDEINGALHQPFEDLLLRHVTHLQHSTAVDA